MDEDAALKEMDYTSMKTLQFVAGLQDPSLREIRLRMLRRLDTQPEDAPLTIEDLVAECENITALKVDNANMEGSHDVHAVQKKKGQVLQMWRTTLQNLLSSSHETVSEETEEDTPAAQEE